MDSQQKNLKPAGIGTHWHPDLNVGTLISKKTPITEISETHYEYVTKEILGYDHKYLRNSEIGQSKHSIPNITLPEKEFRYGMVVPDSDNVKSVLLSEVKTPLSYNEIKPDNKKIAGYEYEKTLNGVANCLSWPEPLDINEKSESRQKNESNNSNLDQKEKEIFFFNRQDSDSLSKDAAALRFRTYNTNIHDRIKIPISLETEAPGTQLKRNYIWSKETQEDTFQFGYKTNTGGRASDCFINSTDNDTLPSILPYLTDTPRKAQSENVTTYKPKSRLDMTSGSMMKQLMKNGEFPCKSSYQEFHCSKDSWLDSSQIKAVGDDLTQHNYNLKTHSNNPLVLLTPLKSNNLNHSNNNSRTNSTCVKIDHTRTSEKEKRPLNQPCLLTAATDGFSTELSTYEYNACVDGLIKESMWREDFQPYYSNSPVERKVRQGNINYNPLANLPNKSTVMFNSRSENISAKLHDQTPLLSLAEKLKFSKIRREKPIGRSLAFEPLGELVHGVKSGLDNESVSSLLKVNNVIEPEIAISHNEENRPAGIVGEIAGKSIERVMGIVEEPEIQKSRMPLVKLLSVFKNVPGFSEDWWESICEKYTDGYSTCKDLKESFLTWQLKT